MLGSASHFVVQIHYTHLKQMLFRGFRGHIGITLSCQFLCSVSATPPYKQLNRYWRNFTQLQYIYLRMCMNEDNSDPNYFKGDNQ